MPHRVNQKRYQAQGPRDKDTIRDNSPMFKPAVMRFPLIWLNNVRLAVKYAARSAFCFSNLT